MHVLPIMGQIQQNKINFSGKLIVYIPHREEGKKTKYKQETIDLDADLSSYLDSYITYNLRKYNCFMHDYVYEGIMGILEKNSKVQEQKTKKNIKLPHAFRPQDLSYNVPIDYLVYPEYSSSMVQFSKWRDGDNLHLKIGKAIEIIV